MNTKTIISIDKYGTDDGQNKLIENSRYVLKL